MCSPQLMQDMQSAMQQYQGGGQQMQLGPVGGAAPQPMQAPQQAQPAPQPIPPQVIAALAARHAAQATTYLRAS